MTLLSRYVQGIIRHKLIIFVVLASAIGVAITSKDFFMTPLAAGTLAGIAVVGLRRIWQSGPWSEWKHVRTAQTLCMAAVPLAFTAGLSVDGGHLFEQAFSVPAPAGIRGLTVDANLLNPAGERTALIRFTADPDAMSGLMAEAAFEPDPQVREARAADETWDNLIRQTLGDAARFGGTAWQSIRPMTAPTFRQWTRSQDGLRMATRVLWDTATGEAFVLYTVR